MAIPGNFLSETTSTVDPNTSGWTAHLNCTLGHGSGGTVTNGCLFMKSVAAGEMQCRTVASYSVTQGTEYAAFADASSGTVPERIGIRWLDAASAELSITWSMTTASATASWHRIAVADWAPDGAVYAQVIFSSTPLAAGVNTFVDHVYLGLPQRTTGNLLSANTETSERASGWEYLAVTNCTIDRTMPAAFWSSTAYTAGGHVATMTVTANGDADFRSTDWPAVTPGQEYLAYAYLNPPSAGSAAWIELRFYDATFAQIQATRAVLAAPGTAWYRQRVSDVAPANAAYATVAFGLTGATAGQLLRTDGAVIAVATDAVFEGSVMPYSDASFEAGIGDWTVVSGVAALARLEPWGTDALTGSYSMRLTSATATTSVIRSGRMPVGDAAGQTWTVSASMKAIAGSWTLSRGIRWYDGADTDLGVTASATDALPTPGWWQLITQAVAPAGATQAEAEYTLTADASSSELYIDRVGLWQSMPLAEAVAHQETASVTVTLRELNLGMTLTMWRVRADGTRTLVRGADGLIDAVTIDSETLVIEDYESPLGVPVYWYSETRNGTLLSQTRATLAVTLDVPDPNMCWLKDPGNPQRNGRFQVVSAPDWERPITQAEHRVRRRRNAVVFSDVRGGLEGPLVLRTRDDDERAELHFVLDSGNALLLQLAPGLGLEDMYVNVGPVIEGRITGYGGEPRRLWTLPLKQADMPVAVGVAGSAGRTWQDILTENTDWQEVLDSYATWEDVLLNRPAGG
ncbi:hypothetical protein ACWGI0_23290 [Streptomyces sp. NPDC054802]